MANLTIAIDDKVLKKARIRAIEEGTSVNAILREYLELYSGVRGGHEAATAAILNLSRKSRSRRGAQRWNRDDLHNRGL